MDYFRGGLRGSISAAAHSKEDEEMVRKTIWLWVNCVVVATLLLVPCGPAVTEEGFLPLGGKSHYKGLTGVRELAPVPE